MTAGLAGQAFLQQFVRRWEVHVAVTKFLVTVFQFADPVINHQSVFLTNGPTPALTAVPGPGSPAPQVLKKQASLLASSYVWAHGVGVVGCGWVLSEGSGSAGQGRGTVPDWQGVLSCMLLPFPPYTAP